MDDAVEVSPACGGAGLRLRVHAGARRERLVGPHGGALKLEVQAPPERGKANAAVVRLLARALDLPRSALTIAAGSLSSDKRVVVAAMSPEELVRRLGRAGVAARSLS